MKITALKTFLVPPRWLFLKIETDEGISGWGEPILEGHAETLAAQIAEFSDFLIGRDPARINDIWQMLYRNGCYRGGPVLMSAISGIDMALWDIKGRSLGVPVYQLLGGRVRDRVRSYTWIGGDEATTLIEDAHKARAAGFNAVKFNVAGRVPLIASHARIDAIMANLGALRDAVGPEFDLAVDFHGRISTPMAKVLLKELAPLRPLFVEDPVLPGQIPEIAALARTTSIPLAAGERLHNRAEFRYLFELGAVGLINPDTAHIGGISEMVKLAAWAETYDVSVGPHCPLGPIALAACLQIDAVSYSASLQEFAGAIHYNSDVSHADYLADCTPIQTKNGFLDIPGGPGLGIEIDETAVEKYAAIGHRWRAPIWRHEDGSVAEW